MLTCLCSHRDKGVLVAWRASGEAGQWLVRLRRVEERPKSVKIVQYASIILLTAQTVVVGTWGSQIWIFLYSNNPMAYLPLKLLYFVLLKKEHLRRLHLSSRCCLHHHYRWHRHGCHHHHHHQRHHHHHHRHHHHRHYQQKLTRRHLTLQSCCLPALQKLWEDKGKQKQANMLKVNNFSACNLFLSINAAA